MGGEPLEYSRHALRKMRTYGVTGDEVEAIVSYADWRCRSRDGRMEHYGYSENGRLFRVVTDHAERKVITVIQNPLR